MDFKVNVFCLVINELNCVNDINLIYISLYVYMDIGVLLIFLWFEGEDVMEFYILYVILLICSWY